MILIGGKKVKSCYLGDVPIGRMYLGDDLIFKAKKPSRLPDGYTEVEYIQSDNGCSINTGYTYFNCSRTRVAVDIEAGEYSGSAEVIFAYPMVKAGSAYYQFYATRSYSNNIKYSNGAGITKTLVADITGQRCVVDLNGVAGYFSAGSAKQTFTVTSSTANYTTTGAAIFGQTATGRSISAKLYSAKIYYIQNLECDLVPCINPSGEVGLYDIVRDGFYGNSGAGTLTAGPAV